MLIHLVILLIYTIFIYIYIYIFNYIKQSYIYYNNYCSNTDVHCDINNLYALTSTECIPTCENPSVPKSCISNDDEICRCTNPSEVVINGECKPIQECPCTDVFGNVTMV